MYSVQASPNFQVVMDNGVTIKPVATLKNDAGGVSHIIVDDHCYVLINEFDGVGHKVYHWYPEAVEALKTLPGLTPN
jgi:hypothetical protein